MNTSSILIEASSAVTFLTTSTMSASSNSSSATNSPKLNTDEVIGVSVGAFLVVALTLSAIIFCCVRRRRKGKHAADTADSHEADDSSSAVTPAAVESNGPHNGNSSGTATGRANTATAHPVLQVRNVQNNRSTDPEHDVYSSLSRESDISRPSHHYNVLVPPEHVLVAEEEKRRDVDATTGAGVKKALMPPKKLLQKDSPISNTQISKDNNIDYVNSEETKNLVSTPTPVVNSNANSNKSNISNNENNDDRKNENGKKTKKTAMETDNREQKTESSHYKNVPNITKTYHGVNDAFYVNTSPGTFSFGDSSTSDNKQQHKKKKQQQEEKQQPQ